MFVGENADCTPPLCSKLKVMSVYLHGLFRFMMMPCMIMLSVYHVVSKTFNIEATENMVQCNTLTH